MSLLHSCKNVSHYFFIQHRTSLLCPNPTPTEITNWSWLYLLKCVQVKQKVNGLYFYALNRYTIQWALRYGVWVYWPLQGQKLLLLSVWKVSVCSTVGFLFVLVLLDESRCFLLKVRISILTSQLIWHLLAYSIICIGWHCPSNGEKANLEASHISSYTYHTWIICLPYLFSFCSRYNLNSWLQIEFLKIKSHGLQEHTI